MDFNGAKSYATEKLGVEYVDNKLVLLNKLIRAFYDKVPFQNISVSLLPSKDRFPSEETVLAAGKSLEGGLGLHKNWFFKIFLEALGYKTYFVAADVLLPPAAQKRPLGVHIAIVVQDLTKAGDLHLVDVGSGYPLFAAVPLNDLPYTTKDITLTYRIVEENGYWHREHKDKSSDVYTRFLSYEKTPRPSIDFFRKPMLELLNEDWIVGGIISVRYPQPNSADIPDVPDFKKEYDYVIVYRENALLFKNSSGYEHTDRVEKDQIVSTIEKYYPSIPRAKILEKIKRSGN